MRQDKSKCADELSASGSAAKGRENAMIDLPHAELDKDTIAKAYARWAPVYDLVFGAVFERGRHAAIAAAERIGGRIPQGGGGARRYLPPHSRRHPPFRGPNF